jgi:hypothetical protein
MGSVDKPWSVERDGRVYGLQVVKLKRTYVLPWSQFLYAEGSNDEVKAYFTTHDIVVTGSDLGSLLADFAAQQVTILREPQRTERFDPTAGPRIFALEVRRIEPDSTGD